MYGVFHKNYNLNGFGILLKLNGDFQQSLMKLVDLRENLSRIIDDINSIAKAVKQTLGPLTTPLMM